MQLMGDWAKPMFQAAQKNAGMEFACVPAPGTAKAYSFAVDSFALFKVNSPARIKAQKDFASDLISPAVQQAFNLAKQMSVPHGNSILALGSYATGTGVPIIPPAAVLPSGDVDSFPYFWKNAATNPNLTYTSNPNQALVDALAIQAPSDFITLAVSSSNGNGDVSNIGFEQKKSNLTAYDFTCWLESFDGGTSFPQLQYTQTITMLLTVRGGRVSFPHVTVNTLTKKSS